MNVASAGSIFAVCAVAIFCYFKFAQTKGHRITQAFMTVLLVLSAVVYQFRLNDVKKPDDAEKQAKNSQPSTTPAVAQPAKNSVPPSMSRAKHAPMHKSNVTQIALGAQSSNINEVDRDLIINYGVAAGQSLQSEPEVKK